MCIKLGLSQLIFTILTIGYVKRFSSTSTIIRLSQLFSISLGIDDVMNYAIKSRYDTRVHLALHNCLNQALQNLPHEARTDVNKTESLKETRCTTEKITEFMKDSQARVGIRSNLFITASTPFMFE